tara:strand:- start:854 stop:1936 length:1083 start_codon:yes stop_codon:yes gene_type:complete
MTNDLTMYKSNVMKPKMSVGIVGYGSYIPRFRVSTSEIASTWGIESSRLPVKEKSVAGIDEDVVTMSIEAARNAISRGRIDAQELGAVWIGSESHPYAVKPSSTIVAEAIGAVPNTQAADWQFACKAGTEALQAGIGFVGSGMSKYAIAIGMDTAQSRPGDVLEYTAGSGGAAFVLGSSEKSVVVIEGSNSFVTDTPDFWRRQHAIYPEHGQRFTGEPSYFRHIVSCGQQLMTAMNTSPSDYDHVVFHQPNSKFPRQVGKLFGFAEEQMSVGLLADEIGNVYAGSSLLGLTAVLDVAVAGDKIMLISFGSGAGSDAFHLSVNDNITLVQNLAPTTKSYLTRKTMIDYATYARFNRKLDLG